METGDIITIDPQILGGVPVFKGTRVSVRTLFEYLEDDYPLDEFLECFPSVTREMAQSVLQSGRVGRYSGLPPTNAFGKTVGRSTDPPYKSEVRR